MKHIKPKYFLVCIVTSSDEQEKATNLCILETHLRSNHESCTTNYLFKNACCMYCIIYLPPSELHGYQYKRDSATKASVY